MIRPVALHSTATHEALATLNMDEARRTRILVHRIVLRAWLIVAGPAAAALLNQSASAQHVSTH